jgi:O-succinylbenzoic acid--CoA ligase
MCLGGRGPLSPALLHAADAASLPIFTSYGMTEMSSIITLGTTMPPYRNLKIEKDGEIWVGGKTLCQGYWDPVMKTVAKADQEGWFPTKDLGRWSEGGQLEILGRKDRQFISGGENIQPEEIERALCSLPGIRQASVLPIPDEEFGQKPAVFIEDENNRSLAIVRENLEGILPRFMHPVRIFPYPSSSDFKPHLLALRAALSQILKQHEETQE